MAFIATTAFAQHSQPWQPRIILESVVVTHGNGNTVYNRFVITNLGQLVQYQSVNGGYTSWELFSISRGLSGPPMFARCR